jgi:predicted methyltransferase
MMTRHFAFAASALALMAASCSTSAPAGPPPIPAADYAAVLADPGRPEADRKDDEARKPAEVLAFSEIRKGDTVLELEAGRGWYSDLISTAIGPTGKLIAQYPPEFAYGDAAFKTRKDAGRLTNTVITKSHFDTLDVPNGSVDRVLWILGPHELYYTPPNSTGLGRDDKTYAEIMRVLKPGGLFIAMDHAAEKGAPVGIAQTIHRIDPSVVLSSAESAGFKYVAKNDLLANPADDRTKMVFDPTIRRHTDQFLFKFRKPG